MAESMGLWPNPSGNSRSFAVIGNSASSGESWLEWRRPASCRGAAFFLTGSGGCGGTGVLGASGSAAGGGGGGSAGQTVVEMPAVFLPERVYISVATGAMSAGFSSYVSAMPNTTANHVIAIANGGGAGGNGSGATGGTAGSAGAIATAATMPLGWPFAKLALAGQAGTAGGGTVAGVALTLPTTGLRITGGTGGGGFTTLNRNGGDFTTPSDASVFPPHLGGAADPKKNGAPGYLVRGAGLYWYGGTGGAARAGSDTFQYEGGYGGFGCGGGGMSGAETTDTPAVQSYGGSGICIVTWW